MKLCQVRRFTELVFRHQAPAQFVEDGAGLGHVVGRHLAQLIGRLAQAFHVQQLLHLLAADTERLSHRQLGERITVAL